MSKSFQFSGGEEPKTKVEPDDEEEGFVGRFTRGFDDVLNCMFPTETRVFLDLQ